MKIYLITGLLAAALVLTACDALGVRDPTLHDQVPPEVKAQPLAVQKADIKDANNQTWPRLGDVPFKPKDFSTKPVYDHYMNELEYERATAQQDKQTIEGGNASLQPDAVTSAPLSSPSAKGL